jgi:putative methyltransferase (TIGR04325 family)
MNQIFLGIYKSFLDSGGDVNVFETEMYLSHIQKKLQSFNKVSFSQYGNIPLLVDLLSTSNKKINILDYGGGAGETFLKINKNIFNPSIVDYNVLDNINIINVGKKYYDNYIHTENINLKFYDIKKESIYNLYEPDILQLGSVLQYVEHWKDFLHNIFKYKPEYILLEDIFTGNIPNYVTLQKFFDKLIPFQFLNIDDLLNFFTYSNYSVINYSDCVPYIHGKEIFYDMNNLPSKYRISRTKNIILKKL